MYQNHNSTDTSFLDLLSTNPQNPSRMENHHSLDDQERNLHYQELSLSLGMQITSSSMDLPSFQYNYLNTHLQDSGDHGSQSNKVENIDYLSFDLVGGVSGVAKDRSTNNGQCSISGYQIPSGVVARIYNSRYLKPSQELLDEVANLHEAIRQVKMKRFNNLQKLGVDRFDENNSRINSQSVRCSMGEPLESATSSSGQLSASEKQDLQNKIAKLVSLLDEVDRKYREYCQRLRVVEASLDMVAGCGAARSYTTLAHHTISRHFRCLRDAINGQIQATRQTLGEQDDSSDRVLPRLRNVEKQLRQQGSLHPLGVMRHSWRPQRGLPEGSVSILRAWLFEHFLNPYVFFHLLLLGYLPERFRKDDAGKTNRAHKKPGTFIISTSNSFLIGALLIAKSLLYQIANWFINARVRLWKPMVEDMYKEEFRDEEVNGRSSPKAAIDQSWSSEDKEKDLQTNTSARISDSNPEFVNDMEVNGYAAQRHIDIADQYRFDDSQLLPDFVV
ncbi:hypothetical protein OSB04_005135 [Centaurea solstitialis]|uniref:POX domain-containing protein n=1 Tax=Centaurea solstitialis TaxID=347529 RepID=A0AA38TS23_9ASTR|nr:hypothetical protein OSB04_005135 [Centaurea solstitialis]